MPRSMGVAYYVAAFFFAAMLGGCEGSQSQPVVTVPPYEIVEVVPGVWALLANPGGTGVGNAAIMDMGQTVVVWDTGLTPDAGRQILQTVADLTGNPVRFVMNSHSHDDHVGGNQVFGNSSYFATSATQQAVLAAGSEHSAESIERAEGLLSRLEEQQASVDDPLAKREIAELMGYMLGIVTSADEFQRQAPTVVFDNRINFSDADRQVKFIPMPSGHTAGNAVLWLEADSVLLAGDLVATDRHPRMQDGGLEGWKAALAEILTLQFDVVVPGHGPLGDRASVARMQDYLAFVERSAQAVAEGASIDEIPIDSAFAGWMLETQFRENVRFVSESRAQ